MRIQHVRSLAVMTIATSLSSAPLKYNKNFKINASAKNYIPIPAVIRSNVAFYEYISISTPQLLDDEVAFSM